MADRDRGCEGRDNGGGDPRSDSGWGCACREAGEYTSDARRVETGAAGCEWPGTSGTACHIGARSAETHRAAGSMTPTIRPSRTVAVGPEVLAETLQEELDARGWTAADLARRGGCHVYWMERVLAGGEPSWHDALVIGRAMGTSAEFWMGLWRGRQVRPRARPLLRRLGLWRVVPGWTKSRHGAAG